MTAVAILAFLGGWLFVNSLDSPESPKNVPVAPAVPLAPNAPVQPPLPAHVTPPPALRETRPPPVSTRLNPRQRFATATNYKRLYDELASIQDETGEARYFMGRSLIACYLPIAFTLEQLEKTAPDLPQFANKRAAFRELDRQCDGFHGHKGPSSAALMQQAAAKGYPGAAAALVRESDGAKGEAVVARLLQEGDPEALYMLQYYLQMRARSWMLEVDGQAPRADVAADAWRLYACSRGADCGPFLFEQCWAKDQCGAINFQDYLRTYKPESYASIVTLEESIARAVRARDWRALGIVKNGGN